MLAASGAELLKFQAALQFLFVLQRAIVRVFTHRALELDHVVLGHNGEMHSKDDETVMDTAIFVKHIPPIAQTERRGARSGAYGRQQR